MRKLGGERESISPEEAEGSSHFFHYSREERLRKAGNAIQGQDKRPWFRRNRGTFILLLDLLLIVLIFIMYNLFLKPDNSRIEYGSHSYELKALEFDGELLVSLRVEALEDLVSGSAGTLQLEVSRQGDFSEAGELLDLLPGRLGETRIYRLRLPPQQPDASGTEDSGGGDADDRKDAAPMVYARIDVQGPDPGIQWDFELSSLVELE